MPKRRKKRRTRRSGSSALSIVRAARAAAKSALASLREEIRQMTAKLEKLVAEERSFRVDILGSAPARRGRPPKAGRRGRPPKRAARRKGPPLAERFFQKLPKSFTLDDVRKLAGRKAGISLAQWSRAKRIRKSGNGYQKVAA
jgi:hypothetical protein